MFFVIVGALVIVLHLAGIGPMAAWNWQLTGDLWKFCLPFALAAAWWAWSDSTGRTRRLEMDKMDERKAERRRRNMVALGMDPGKHDKQRAQYRAHKATQAEKIEKARTEEREKKRISVISSHMDSELAPREEPPGWARSKQ